MENRIVYDKQRWFYAGSLFIAAVWVIVTLAFPLVGYWDYNVNGFDLFSYLGPNAFSWVQLSTAIISMFIAVLGLFLFPKTALKIVSIVFVSICAFMVLMYFVEGCIFASGFSFSTIPFIIEIFILAAYFILLNTTFNNRGNNSPKKQRITYKDAKDVLSELKDMKELGILSEEEYNKKRKEIVDKI